MHFAFIMSNQKPIASPPISYMLLLRRHTRAHSPSKLIKWQTDQVSKNHVPYIDMIMLCYACKIHGDYTTMPDPSHVYECKRCRS